MEKPRAIRHFENINNISLTETKDSVYYEYNPDKIKNVYKLNEEGEVIALNIGGNNFEEFNWNASFYNLEQLYIQGNNLQNLSFIRKFPNLKIINISGNQIKDDGLYFHNEIEKIYLDRNQLTVIPDLRFFPKLKSLSLKENHLSRIITKNKSPILEELYLDRNKIVTIENLDFFSNLKKLSLSDNQIKDIENLNLASLNDLDLSGNEIEEIKNLEKLVNLNTLNLSFNSITEIQNLEHLNKLHILFLSDNSIQIIQNLEKLENLVNLNLWANNITEIKGLDRLVNLRSLYLWKNKIQKIQGLSKLRNLGHLDVGRNLITKIEGIRSLKKLRHIDLDNNQISKIEEVSSLENLNKLIMSNNLIEDLNDCEDLLHSSVKELKIHNNPFLQRNNILLEEKDNHLDTIKNELEKLEKSKEPIELPVKIMLLGNHASGKSTFLDYFMEDTLQNKSESTHILKIVNYPKSYKRRKSQLPRAIFYDFGGQDYYHGVYQAFLTLDTINLLFWKYETDSIIKDLDSKKHKIIHFNKQYWLYQIEFANSQRKKYFKDATEEINYVVQTHSDTDSQKNPTEENIKQTFFVSLLENYKSLKNEFALKHLKETIKEEIRNHSKSVKKTKNEIDLYRYISSYHKSEWIEVKDLVGVYNSSLSNLKAELEQLSMKGMILYYKNIPSLENYVWLNPSKTVEKIHEILSEQKNGKVAKVEFENQINDAKIIDMLKENKVIFFDDYDEHYIIPGYLDFAHEEKEEFFYFAEYDNPNYILKFLKFIPFGFINQLICHFGKNPEKKVYWRNQLVFTHQESRVRIKIDFELLEIKVFIKSPKKEKLRNIEKDIFLDILHLYWDENIPTPEKQDKEYRKESFFEKVKDFFDDKDNTIKNPREKILYRGIKDLYLSLNNGESYVSHSELQNLEKGTFTINTYKIVNDVANNLGVSYANYFKNFTNNVNVNSMKKIFISYSRKDDGFKDELKKHLNMLKLFDIADNWSCEQITIGNWHNQIQKELEESDMIVYMLSKNFFNSKYILEQEVQKGMDLIDADPKKKILGIIVGSFPNLDLLKSSSNNRSDLQDSVLKLSENQYLPYGNIKNNASGLIENKIIPLDIYNKVCIDGNLDTALEQITTKIVEALK